MIRLVLILGITYSSLVAQAQTESVSYSLLLQAYAPNAGGQDVYSLRRGTDASEWSIFGNTYLLAGGYPLVGGLYSRRFTLCGRECWIQAFVQAGAGLSTGGPLFEVSWSTVFLWVARVDFASQLYVTQRRFVSWSVPLWIGVSVPVIW